jgi:hypothetical protein
VNEEPKSADPLAVALGNASLVGLGYLMLRRWKTAIAALLVTGALVAILLVLQAVWCELALLAWWILVIAHGWFLARAQPGRAAVRFDRVVALGVAVPVLLAVGILRYDAARIEQKVAEARASGDCGRVTAAQREVWSGVRIADAPSTVRGDRDVRACERLETAKTDLIIGLTGDTKALEEAFGTLASVLAEPGQDSTVGAVLNEFLDALPTKSPCTTLTITDWLRERKPTHNLLDRSIDAVQRTEPAALVACGDVHAGELRWPDARSMYQELLKRYPNDRLVAKARAGVKRATLQLELKNVRDLVGSSGNYCSSPAQYSGAAPYRRGVNRALFVGGTDEYWARLPAQWRTTDVANAVLMICADEAEFGTAVRTCPYESKLLVWSSVDVTFRKIAIPLKAFELRTGRLVASTTIEIGGSSCPATLHYSSYSPVADPPSTVYVTPSSANVQAAFKPLLVR